MRDRVVMRLKAAPGITPQPMSNKDKATLLRSYRVNNEQKRKEFANRLKALRESAKMTQKQLADKAGLHEGLITRYETAGAMPRDSTLFGNYGITVTPTKNGIVFSVPGYQNVTIDLKVLVTLYDSCTEETEKAFQKVKEDFFVNLFIRELFYDEMPIDRTRPHWNDKK